MLLAAIHIVPCTVWLNGQKSSAAKVVMTKSLTFIMFLVPWASLPWRLLRQRHGNVSFQRDRFIFWVIYHIRYSILQSDRVSTVWLGRNIDLHSPLPINVIADSTAVLASADHLSLLGFPMCGHHHHFDLLGHIARRLLRLPHLHWQAFDEMECTPSELSQ